MMLVRSFILGLDVDFVAQVHPLTKNETKYDFVAMVPTGRIHWQELKY
jgi:O-succinylbenzoic acid--CoA ligase